MRVRDRLPDLRWPEVAHAADGNEGNCMHRLTRRVVNMERRTMSGTCPHRPPLVVYENDWHAPARKPPRERPCWCGRPRLCIVVRYEEDWANRYEEADAES